MTPLTTHRVLEVASKIETTINGERLDGLPIRSITGKKLSVAKSKFLKIENQRRAMTNGVYIYVDMPMFDLLLL